MCKYYTEKLRKANSTQETREYSVSPEIDTEQDADVDNSVEQAFLDGVNGVVFDWNVDSVAENGYNSERGENYAATDEFRRLQEESKGMSDEEIQLYHSGEREVNEELRKNISGILRSQIDAARNGVRNDYGILNLSAKGNQFNIYEGVDGRNLDGYGNNFESEILFPRGTLFVVNNIKYNANRTPTIYLTEVQSDGSSRITEQEIGGDFSGYNRGQQKVSSESGTSEVQRLSTQSAEDSEMPSFVSERNTKRLIGRKFQMQGVQAEGTGQLKQNIGVSEADSSESASFMPENESVLPDVSAADGETDSYEAFTKRYNGTLELTEDQKLIQSICTALGTDVVFKNLDRWATGKDGKRRFFSPDGYFDKATGKIYVNTSTNGKHNPLLFVIKHELTHFGEINKTAYDSFVKAVKKSKEFKAWLEYKTGMKGETTDRMAAKLGADIRDERSKYGIDVGVAESEQEVIANFAGDILFAKSGKTLDSLLNSVEAKQRPKVIQAVVDFFRWLREKLSGNKDLTFELQRLESKYSAMLKGAQTAVQNKNSTGEGGQFSISSDKFSEYNKPITLDDIKMLRNIGRKSINEFTTDELEVAQKWAYKFYQQLGTKSPFFRRWFGDWRAYDIEPANIVSFTYGEQGIINRFTRSVHNEDLNSNIIVDSNVVDDSVSYAKKTATKNRYANCWVRLMK